MLNRSEICLCVSLCRINNAKKKGPGTISTHVALKCQGKGKGKEKGKGRGRRGESLELSLVSVFGPAKKTVRTINTLPYQCLFELFQNYTNIWKGNINNQLSSVAFCCLKMF